MSNTINESYCRPCIYYGTSTKTCDYILLADQRRPCSAGEGCTARITRKEQLMAKATWDTETGYQMFLAGNSDTAIGRALGVAAGTVNFYKRKHWLSKESTGGGTRSTAPP